MALTLVVLSGNPTARTPLTLDGPRIVVGRAPNSELRLPDLSISARHASFRQRGSDYLIVDEGSTNGTFVGPVKLSPQAPRVVRHGDRVRFGRIWVEVRLESLPATAQSVAEGRDLALRLLAEAMAELGGSVQPRVVIESGPVQGTELVLEREEQRYVIGRAKNADLILGETNASRRHAEVFRRGGQIYARDLGSKNGTFLADLPLTTKGDTVWPARAKMQIGSDVLGLIDPVAEALLESERGADEVMNTSEEVPVPDASEAGLVDVATPPSPKQSKVNQPPTRKHRRANSPGLRRADILVALFALAVIGSSLLGLFWLLSGR